MYKKLSLLAGTITALLATLPVSAVQFDGFMTTGVSWHDDKNKNRYIGSLGDRGIQNDGSFETDTRFGLQISSDVAENMSVVSQILGTGVNGNFDAIIEWAYVDYEFNDWLSIHAGKIKQPVYLVNDYVEVGYAYPWIRPPVEVYYQNNPLNTVNGIEFLMQYPVGPGVISFQPYFGSNKDDVPNTGGASFFEAENIRGLNVKYSGKGYSVHASGFTCDVKIQGGFSTQAQLAPPPAGTSAVKVDLNGEGQCVVNSVGFNLDMKNIVVFSEWQERLTDSTLSRPFGDQSAWYTTVGYRNGKWLPHITFASIDGTASTATDANGKLAVTCADASCGGVGTNLMNFPVAKQSSVTYGLRYDINDSAALKAEYSVVDVEKGNFGLFDTSFTNPSPTGKVGVTSFALDVIF